MFSKLFSSWGLESEESDLEDLENVCLGMGITPRKVSHCEAQTLYARIVQ
jgi:hypothetical protein